MPSAAEVAPFLTRFRRGRVDHHPERRLGERAIARSAAPVRQRRQRGQLGSLALAAMDATAADLRAVGRRRDVEALAGDGRLAVVVRLDPAVLPDQVRVVAKIIHSY